MSEEFVEYGALNRRLLPLILKVSGWLGASSGEVTNGVSGSKLLSVGIIEKASLLAGMIFVALGGDICDEGNQELTPLGGIFASIGGKSMWRKTNKPIPRLKSRHRKITATSTIVCENPLPPN
jgi:hypothetical protein